MNTLIIVLLSIAAICLIWSVVILFFYEDMQFLYNRSGYKAWKECYRDDVVSAKETVYKNCGHIHSQKEYHFANGKYRAVMFYIDGVFDGCAIFEVKKTHLLLSPFWKKHSHMMYEKLKDIPITEKTDLTQ